MSGYLSRTEAASYQPVFRRLAAPAQNSPPAVVCDAALKSEHGGVGVVLHLGTPGECVVELATDDRVPSPAWIGKTVVFGGHGATTIYGVPLDRQAQLMLARWAQCEVLPRVTKKIDAFIVADSGPPANLQKAKDYALTLVDEPNFICGVGIPPEVIGRVSERWARL